MPTTLNMTVREAHIELLLLADRESHEGFELPSEEDQATRIREAIAIALVGLENHWMFASIGELEFSTRVENGLRGEGITYVVALTRMSEAELLRLPNFGRKSLNEVVLVLKTIDLHLGMFHSVEDVLKEAFFKQGGALARMSYAPN